MYRIENKHGGIVLTGASEQEIWNFFETFGIRNYKVKVNNND